MAAEVRRLIEKTTMASPLSTSEQAFIDIALTLTAQLDVERTCTAVLDIAERLYRARSCWLLLHDSAKDALVTVDFRGPGASSFADARIPLARRSVAQIVFKSQEPLFVPDVREEDRWYNTERVHAAQLQTVFNVPLVFESAAIGVLGLDSPFFSSDTPPTAPDIARVRAIAAQAAIGIKNARLFEAVERDRSRLRRLLQERRQLRGEVEHLRDEVRDVHHPGRGIVGTSAALAGVLEQVEAVAPADSTVLVVGETGTGKELIARAIHDESRRRGKSFIAVNCAALPESLVESELFGHEKGAFTGAIDRKPGKFELAHGGTIFLDEIGDLPAAAQAKLLRVLQEREVLRVGGIRPVPVDVRVIAATNRDLEDCMQSGAFRADLYYRLSVFPIALPPLRSRSEDIPALVEHFVRHFAARQHTRVPRLDPGVLQALTAYSWPGNVRELQNVVERAVILARDGVITREAISVTHAHRIAAQDAPPMGHAREALQPPVTSPPPVVVAFSEAERRAIARALELSGWRISGPGGAAEALGLKPTTLHAKMKKLGIRRPSATLAGAGSPQEANPPESAETGRVIAAAGLFDGDRFRRD